MSRADRVVGAARRARARRAAGHRPRQPPLPHRASPAPAGSRSSGRTCGASSPTSATSSGARPRSTASTASARRRSSPTALETGWPEGTVRLGFEDAARVACAGTRGCASCCPSASSSSPPAGVGRGRARGQGARRDRARSAPRPRSSTTIYDWLLRARPGRAAPSARSRSRSSTRCACAARRARASLDRRLGRARRAAARRAARRARSPRDTLVTLDIGARARRLLLGLHAHVGDGRARRRPRRDLRRSCCARRWPRWTRCGRARPGREVDAVARDLIAAAGHGEHFGHGLGHGVGLEVARGAAAGAHGRRARSWPGNVVTVEPGVYLPGPRRRADRGSRRRHRDGRDVLSAPPRSSDRRRLRAQARSSGASAADTGRDGTSSPHPPLPAPRRHRGRARRARSCPPTAGAAVHAHAAEEEGQAARGHRRSPR